MLTAIRDKILEILAATGKFADTGVFQGDPDEIEKRPKRVPAAFCALAVGTFGMVKTLPPRGANLSMEWDVVLVYSSLGRADSAAASGYDLIEMICAPAAEGGITGTKVTGGMLWPRDLELLSVKNGQTTYRISFGIEAEM